MQAPQLLKTMILAKSQGIGQKQVRDDAGWFLCRSKNRTRFRFPGGTASASMLAKPHTETNFTASFGTEAIRGGARLVLLALD